MSQYIDNEQPGATSAPIKVKSPNAITLNSIIKQQKMDYILNCQILVRNLFSPRIKLFHDDILYKMRKNPNIYKKGVSYIYKINRSETYFANEPNTYINVDEIVRSNIGQMVLIELLKPFNENDDFFISVSYLPIISCCLLSQSGIKLTLHIDGKYHHFYDND